MRRALPVSAVPAVHACVGNGLSGGVPRSWDYFMPVYNCPLKEKIGIAPRLGDNGKWLCGVRTLLQKDNCVVYSFGSNGETSFEQDLLSKTGCEIHIFDRGRSLSSCVVHACGGSGMR